MPQGFQEWSILYSCFQNAKNLKAASPKTYKGNHENTTDKDFVVSRQFSSPWLKHPLQFMSNRLT